MTPKEGAAGENKLVERGSSQPMDLTRHPLIDCFLAQGVSDYFGQLPGVDNPEIFGMHENANVTFNTNESLGLMHTASVRSLCR